MLPPSILLGYQLVAITKATAIEALRQPASTEYLAKDLLGGFPYNPLYQSRPDECPPCFNCLLPAFNCAQFAKCSPYNGICDCPPGFGGEDCLQPVCGSLGQGKDRPMRKGKDCECSDGWTGLNCNVCQTDDACTPLMPEGINGTCYKGGLVVHENHQMCDVTNQKILDQLKEKKPQVTFSCREEDKTCNFQFWVDRVESFYCGLEDCEFSQTNSFDRNTTSYNCKNIQCSCIPDRMLCGESGSIDISDFLTEEIKGPGSFVCSSAAGDCRFEEPAMNELISDVFGDRSITLDCKSSECLHQSEVPGYIRPQKPSNTALIVASITIASVLLILLGLGLWYVARRSQQQNTVGEIRLPDDESDKLMAQHTPAVLQFSEVNYNVKGKQILDSVRGNVYPGELMAIMGASGAGKTSLLDLLARKHKTGTGKGQFLVNGTTVRDSEFRAVAGFVDQEDALMPTLTVYETILYSALLRLPRTMSYESKNMRVLETMAELGILHIKDSAIGQEGTRGISGGEKRRVSIACELVTSPSILFLDEPTSGLDSYNAYNVVECLVNLARNYRRTIVLTIHQPRSNIVALFDQLVLLAQGRVVYSGALEGCHSYLENIGLPCPPGFNIADYLIDLTMAQSTGISKMPRGPVVDSNLQADVTNGTSHDVRPHVLERCNSIGDDAVQAWGGGSSPLTPSSLPRDTFDTRVSPDTLIEYYNNSQESQLIIDSIEKAKQDAGDRPQELNQPLGAGYQRISLLAQFVLLSKRTFKNLYRNPSLLLAHYGIALLMALLSGYLFFNISNDLPGFQGRLGLFFFILSLFGFGTLSSLSLFASERNIFMRERSNGYYTSVVYFVAKVIFDIIPLRVLPPLLMGLIIYPLVGLVPEAVVFGRFLLILVFFNLAASAVCLFIGIIIRDTSVANLIGSLFMLFSLLFAGLLLNHGQSLKRI